MEVVRETLPQARQARLFILEKMEQTISASRPELSKYAPRMYKITIDPAKIGAVIGTGGRTIRSIIEETKTTIDVDNEGTVIIGATNEESARKAIDIIESLTKEVEVGAVYTGKVSRILNFGAMVEIAPGKEGLVHISELADYRVAKVEDEVKVGDEVTVKVIGIDDMGRVNLSRRALFEKEPREAGARVPQSPSRDYSFKKRDSRPPRSKGSYHNRPSRGPSRGPRR
jgi:polyribonucleotide nucleotidyltransferase